MFGSKDSLTNSFQIVITTDGISSYTIYNYGKLSWYKDSRNYALYNAGDGVKYYILQGSLSSSILDLSSSSNVGIIGKWIFNIGNYSNFVTTTKIPFPVLFLIQLK